MPKRQAKQTLFPFLPRSLMLIDSAFGIVFVSILLFMLFECVIITSPAQRGNPGKGSNAGRDSLETIISRLEQGQSRNPARYRTYTVTRDYRFFRGESEPRSEVVARIRFVPPNRKTYSIEKSLGGSWGTKVVRRILEHESDLSRHLDQQVALTRDNYQFAFLGTATIDAHPCYVLALTPKRKEQNLIGGRAWIDQSLYMPRNVEGYLSKTPSWWLKKVHLTLQFKDMDGLWLQGGTRAQATVRLFGEYLITSDALDYQTLTVATPGGPAVEESRRRETSWNPCEPLFVASCRAERLTAALAEAF